MSKQIKNHLKFFSDDLHIVNKLIVSAYLKFNNLKVEKNRHILKLLSGNDKREIESFLMLLREHSETFNFEDVINLFEITIPTKDVVVNGAIYTPKYIRDYITSNSLALLKINTKVKVADIACGSGAFLYTAAKHLKDNTSASLHEIYKNNIFGLDISEYAIERTKILLTLFAITEGEDRDEFTFNLFHGNTLEFDWNRKIKKFDGFDAIIGNPPYVRTKNLDLTSKKLMKNWKVANSGNADLYIPFFEIGVKYLKANGCLGYITVNTFKRSVNARALRSFFNEESLRLDMIDFGASQVFDDKMTYTSIVFIHKEISDEIGYVKITPDELSHTESLQFTKIKYELLDHHKGWLLADEDILKNIYLIENRGIPLGKKMIIKNGIATLQNGIFIFKPCKEDKKYFYMKYDGQEFKIEKTICRDIIKPNKLKSENEIKKLTEKIIYPYNINASGIVSVMEEEYFEKKYPCAYNYLLEQKDLLMQRDKGKDKKYLWFEFGRTQSINDKGVKLLFPYMSNKPYFVYSDNVDLMFYAGYAIYSESKRELQIIEKILKSTVFWYYVKHTSKPYSSNYYALAKNYVKDFGLCQLSEEEEEWLLSSDSKKDIDEFLIKKYELNI